MHSLDLFVQSYFSSIRSPGLTEYMYLLSSFFDVSVYSILVVFCFSYFIYLVRGARFAYLFVAALASGAVIVYILKIIFNTARPTDEVMAAFGTSFPSYHAAIATVFFVMLMYVFDTYFNAISRRIFNMLCVASLCLVALSRVYLGVHWLSDVIGGIALGVVVSYICIFGFKRFEKK